MIDDARVTAAVAAAARIYDTDSAIVRHVVIQYLQVGDVYKTAATVGLPWPRVHLLITDLRRAGVNLPKPKRRRAA